MARSFFTIEEVLTLLAETPTRIAALTKGLTPAQLRTAPSRSEWSVNDVIAHLRSCADARGEFTRAILAEDTPTLRAINPRTWIKKTDYRDLEFGPSFRSFTRQRAHLLTFLKSLPRESWSRTAIVTGGGPARERTVLFYAQWVARHEQAHFSHVGDIVNAVRGEKRPVRRSDSVAPLRRRDVGLVARRVGQRPP